MDIEAFLFNIQLKQNQYFCHKILLRNKENKEQFTIFSLSNAVCRKTLTQIGQSGKLSNVRQRLHIIQYINQGSVSKMPKSLVSFRVQFVRTMCKSRFSAICCWLIVDMKSLCYFLEWLC